MPDKHVRPAAHQGLITDVMSRHWNTNDFRDGMESRPTQTGRTSICFPFAGDTVGGSHLSVLGLLNRLDRSRYRVVIVPQVPDGRIAALFKDHEIDRNHGLEWASFEPGKRFTLRKTLKAVSQARQIAAYLKSRKIDIVHTNDGGTHATWALPARLAGTRLLWHHRADPKALGIRFAAPLLADQVLSVSDFALPRSRVWRRMVPARIVHSPFDTTLAVNRIDARNELLADAGLPADAITIGFFGNLIDRKRPGLFVEAVAKLGERIGERPVYGLIFGTSDDPEMNAAIAWKVRELGMEDRVLQMGWKSPGAFWIAACDVLMVPAINEPFGRTLIEAMLVGTPVVATASGGNVEAIRDGETGLLTAPENAAALAGNCARLMHDPALRAQIVDRAAAEARQLFGEDLHCEQVSAAYERLVPNTRRTDG